ncbi:hypothetical protein [Alistipes finegoldii]|uniref:hypothetical protein n=1 Tax=Alistipes finegoldii TaxID=214856 RepID=UPI003995CC02
MVDVNRAHVAALRRCPTTAPSSPRAGKKVYDLRGPAERRVGYSWYGTWDNKVLKKYPEWLRRLTEKK